TDVWAKKSDICGVSWKKLFSPFSMAKAACGGPEMNDRWQRVSSICGQSELIVHLGTGERLEVCSAGLPSPEAIESPIETMSKSLTTTFFSIDSLSPFAVVTVSFTG